MSKQKSALLLHFDSLEILNELSDEEAGQLFKAIKCHHYGEELSLSPLVRVAFSSFKNQFARDDKKYQETVIRNKNNGLKGGRPKTQNNPKEPTGLIENPSEAKKADSKSKSKSDSKSDSTLKDMSPTVPVIHEKKPSKQFVKPTPEELVAYFQSKDSTAIEAEKFFHFYESKGWFVGKNKMKVWRSSASLWIGKNKSNTGTQVSNQTLSQVSMRTL
jgi:hypothetical protein